VWEAADSLNDAHKGFWQCDGEENGSYMGAEKDPASDAEGVFVSHNEEGVPGGFHE